MSHLICKTTNLNDCIYGCKNPWVILVCRMSIEVSVVNCSCKNTKSIWLEFLSAFKKSCFRSIDSCINCLCEGLDFRGTEAAVDKYFSAEVTTNFKFCPKKVACLDWSTFSTETSNMMARVKFSGNSFDTRKNGNSYILFLQWLPSKKHCFPVLN